MAAYAMFASTLTSVWALAVPDELRGSSFGLLAAIQSLGNLGASAVGGVIWTAVSPTAAFVNLAAWMLVALVVLLTTRSPRAVEPGGAVAA